MNSVCPFVYLQMTCVERIDHDELGNINYDCLFRYIRSSIVSLILFIAGIVTEMLATTTLRKTKTFLFVFAIFITMLNTSIHEYEVANGAIYVIQADSTLFEGDSSCAAQKMMLTYRDDAVKVIHLGGKNEKGEEMSFTIEEVITALRSSYTEKMAKRGVFLLISLFHFTPKTLMAEMHRRDQIVKAKARASKSATSSASSQSSSNHLHTKTTKKKDDKKVVGVFGFGYPLLINTSFFN